MDEKWTDALNSILNKTFHALLLKKYIKSQKPLLKTILKITKLVLNKLYFTRKNNYFLKVDIQQFFF